MRTRSSDSSTTKIERADIDDVRTSISRRETAVALFEGAVVGSATGNIARALGLAIEVAELEEDAEADV